MAPRANWKSFLRLSIHPTSRSWKPEEMERLEELVANGASPLRAGVIFKRSTKSVQTKARDMRCPFPHSRVVRNQQRLKEEATREQEHRRSP